MITDVEALIHKVNDLERRLSMMMRHGTVTDVKPGMYRATWGDQTPPSSQGQDGGTEGSSSGQSTPWQSPWMRSSQHNGWCTQNTPFQKGQTITSIGMDPEHMTALVFPHSWSDNNPQDKNVATDADTFRIRKPQPEATQSNSSGYSADGSGSQNYQAQQAQDDDDNDVQVTHHYDKIDVRIGSKMSITHDRQAGTVTVKNDKSTHTLYADKIVHQVGDDIVHTMTTDSHTFQAGSGGSIKYVMDKDGHTFSGGQVSHNGLNIGGSHKHEDVMPGSALTGLPIPKS